MGHLVLVAVLTLLGTLRVQVEDTREWARVRHAN